MIPPFFLDDDDDDDDDDDHFFFSDKHWLIRLFVWDGDQTKKNLDKQKDGNYLENHPHL